MNEDLLTLFFRFQFKWKLVIIILMQAIFTNETKINEINSPGLLFYQVGNVYIQENIWKITTRVNMQNYTQELKVLQEGKDFLVELANTIRNNNNETIISDLQALTQEFYILINSIKDINFSTRRNFST